MNISLKSVIVPGVVLLLALTSWLSYGSYKGEKKRADDAEQSLALAKDTIKDMQARQRGVAALDEKYTRELEDAKATIEDLRDDVSAGRRRLQLSATCKGNTSASGSLGNASAPTITATAERDYWRLRDGINTITGQVKYLQDYTRQQCLK